MKTTLLAWISPVFESSGIRSFAFSVCNALLVVVIFSLLLAITNTGIVYVNLRPRWFQCQAKGLNLINTSFSFHSQALCRLGECLKDCYTKTLMQIGWFVSQAMP